MAKPNSAEAKRIKSSLSRERCVATTESAKRYSSAKSRSLTASRLFAVMDAKSQLARQRIAIDGKSAACERSRAQTDKHPLAPRQAATARCRVGILRSAPAASAKAKSAARAASASSRASERSDSFPPGSRTIRSARPARRTLLAPRLSRTSGIPSLSFRCGCARCATLHQSDREPRSTLLRRNDGRPRRSMRQASSDRFERDFRWHRAPSICVRTLPPSASAPPPSRAPTRDRARFHKAASGDRTATIARTRKSSRPGARSNRPPHILSFFGSLNAASLPRLRVAPLAAAL